MIDFRSDTVTKPTKEMLDVMYHAEVGDDGYREDPTVNELEALVADMLGKEAALLVTSGTQGNQIAILAQTKPGDTIIAEAESHIYQSELDAVTALARVNVSPIKGDRGVLPLAELKNQKFSLITIENTHARSGGAIVPLEHMKELYELGIPVHLDGARLFHAAVAKRVSVKEFTKYANTVSICLSKGLGAPVGSVLAGSKAFIEEARIWRKRLGGRMRQAGLIAAPGIYALQNHITRLEQDHKKAKYLEDELQKLEGMTIPFPVETNIVLLNTGALPIDAYELSAKLKGQNILVKPYDKNLIRIVVHLHISEDDIAQTIHSMKAILSRINGQ